MDAENTVVNCSKIISNYPDVIYKLIKYRHFGVRNKYKDIPSPSSEIMDSLANIARNSGVKKVVVT